VLLAACSSDKVAGPVGPSHSVHVTLTNLGSPTVHPGDLISLRVEVKLSAGDIATSAVIRTAGLFADTLNLPIPGQGDFAYNISVQLNRGPFAGDIIFTAAARIGTVADSATARVLVADDGNPTLDVQVLSGPEPGDTMLVLVVARDAAGISFLTVSGAGVIGVYDNTPYAYVAEAAQAYRFYIPPTTAIGAPVTLTVTAHDAFNNMTTQLVQRSVNDLHAPTMTDTLSAGRYDSIVPFRERAYFVGDTFGITYHVRDNRKLGWVGFRLGAVFYDVADSVAVTGTSVDTTIRFPVTPAMEGQDRIMRIFVRDSVGNLLEDTQWRDFVDGTRRAFEIISRPAAGVFDAAYSQAAGQVAVLSNNAVTVLAVQPLRLVGSVATPGAAVSVDVVPGVDTAWAATRASGGGTSLHAVALGAAPSVARVVAVAGGNPASMMRVTSNNRAVITALASFMPTGSATFVDLATGLSSQRPASAFAYGVAASGDHKLLVGYDDYNGQMMTYDVARDSFGLVTNYPAAIPSSPRFSVDGAGNQILVVNRLYSRSLSPLGNVGSAYGNDASFLSADGQYAYFQRFPGLHKVRLSDGALVEKVFSPDGFPGRFVELPDRNRMLIIGGNSYVIIDLSPAGVLP
jgi:hypothetical protein